MCGIIGYVGPRECQPLLLHGLQRERDVMADLRGDADVLLWVSSLSEVRLPPPTTVPTIVLGRSGMAFERAPEVFIPVGTPGLDHAGHLFRADRVVAVPLRGLRVSSLPSVAQAIDAIDAAL